MRNSRKLTLGLVIVMSLLAGQVLAQSMTIDGSTTVGPIADAFAEALQSMHPEVSITVQKTGSGNGIAALTDSRCDVAMSSRFMRQNEFNNAVGNGVFPVAHVVAIDGVCMAIHPSNPVTEITIEQVRGIYTGKITNWSQLGGPNMSIVAVSRDTSSGTYGSFTDAVMNGENMAAAVEYVNSNPQAHARIRSTRGAIGYVGVGFLDDQVRAVSLNGVLPTRQNIATGTYPISRALYLFTDGYPKLGSMAYRYVTFHLTEIGQELVESAGFVPLTEY